MATQAPTTGLVAVQAIGSDQILFAHAVDAREMIATGGYVLCDVQPQATKAKPANDVERRMFVRDTETNAVLVVQPIDAKEMLAGDRYVLHVPTAEAPSAPDAAATEGDVAPLPSITALASVLALIEDADALLTMEARDERVEAKPLYEARFNELASQSTRL